MFKHKPLNFKFMTGVAAAAIGAFILVPIATSIDATSLLGMTLPRLAREVAVDPAVAVPVVALGAAVPVVAVPAVAVPVVALAAVVPVVAIVTAGPVRTMKTAVMKTARPKKARARRRLASRGLPVVSSTEKGKKASGGSTDKGKKGSASSSKGGSSAKAGKSLRHRSRAQRIGTVRFGRA